MKLCLSSRPLTLLAALAALLSTAFGLAPMAQAATLAVPAQYATIQAAINAAANGDMVLVASGTYTGPGDVDIDFNGKGITVASVNGPATTIINCGGTADINHRGFYLHSGENGAVISGFTVKNGYSTNGQGGGTPNDGSGGGIFISDAGIAGTSVTVQNCVITNCAVGAGDPGGSGGGIYAYAESGGAASTITLTNCTISGCTAPYFGAGVYADSGYNGGGGGGAITLNNCTISGNNAAISGGGVYAATNLSTVTFNACTLSGNTTAGDGGGVSTQISSAGTVTLNNCVFTSNSATGSGGGINTFTESISSVILTNCSFTANTAANGGGIADACPLYLNNIILYGDTGGEIYEAPNDVPVYGSPLLRNCDVQGGYSGTNDINADPKYVAAPTDLHLQAGSPCIGAGLLISGVLTDKDGKTRPNPPSIGAYEPAAAVTKAATTLTLSDSPNPSQVNQSVALTAAVSNGTQTVPTGTVQLSYNGSILGSGPLDATGHIIFTITGLSNAASYTFTATYGGDAGNQGCSGMITQTVSAAASTHVLWTNTNGTAAVWNYSSAAGTFTAHNFGPYSGWSAKSLADGTDGVTRLLWDNTSGAAALWSVTGSTGAFTTSNFGPYSGWTANAVSVGSDNTTHLLWNNTSGKAALWNVVGGQYSAEHDFGPYNGWTAKAVADAPDGTTRLLWTNTNGTAALWDVNPSTGAFTQFSFGPYAGWTAKAISVSATTTHVLWSKSDGTEAVWNYTPSSGSFTQKTYGPYSGWTANALADGSDGKVRLLWDNTSGQASFWSVDNVTGQFSQFSFGPYSGWTATAITGE